MNTLISTRPSPLIFACQCIGSIHKKIDSSEGVFGTVLNVFDKAINIKVNNEKLLVVSLGQVASPLTINVVPVPNSATFFSSFTYLIKNGDPVFQAGKRSEKEATRIFLGSECSILIKEPMRIFENQIAKPDLGGLMKFHNYREHLVSELHACASDRAGSLLNPDMTTKGLLAEFMNNILDLKSSEFEANLSSSLLKFCGRGPGFTPGGDDFISGFLAILNWIRLGFKLGSPMIPGSDYQKLTTWTSFKMMECNAQGLVDIEVQDLINCIAQGDVSRYADLLRWISKRGHTSGIDFVTGATIAIYLALDSIRQNSSGREI